MNFCFLGVKTNLHIVLIMDFTRPTFTIQCQSNPGFFKECAVQWMEGWSERSMLKVKKKLFLFLLIIFLFRFHQCYFQKIVLMKKILPKNLI